MNRKDFPLSVDGDFGLAPFHSTGSWPEIEITGIPNSHPSDTSASSSTWESDWIDLGGEG
jgi:hypothetical protein